jgi:hypothetical protein
MELCRLSPTRRVERIRDAQAASDAARLAATLLEHYEAFLERTGVPDSELRELILDPEEHRKFVEADIAFGDTMADLLQAIGANSSLYRLLLV